MTRRPANLQAPHRLMTAAEVAYFLGLTLPTFYRRVRALQRDRNFPRPLLGQDYDPLAIMAWRLAQMDPALRAVMEAAALTAPSPAAIVDVLRVQEVDWADVLDDRAKQFGSAPIVDAAE